MSKISLHNQATVLSGKRPKPRCAPLHETGSWRQEEVMLSKVHWHVHPYGCTYEMVNVQRGQKYLPVANLQIWQGTNVTPGHELIY
jgi:hypothetical protein